MGDTTLPAKLVEVFATNPFPPATDVDLRLYDGFPSDADRRRCEHVRRTPPEALAALHPRFDDARYAELFFRYRARNWPELLSSAERSRWEADRRARLADPACGLSLKAFRLQVARLAVDPAIGPERRTVVSALADWPAAIGL